MSKINKKMKVVVVYSGGLDSTVLLIKCKQEFGEVIALNFNYGSKHNWNERQAARKVCGKLKIPLYCCNIPTSILLDAGVGWCHEEFLKSNPLISDGEIPEGNYDKENMKSTVVPFRNGIMLSLAAAFAESRGFDLVAIANHRGDHAIYPDCRTSFIESIREAIRRGTDIGISLIAPFTDMTKAEIVKLGIELNAPLELTWSCYKGETRPCLKCGTCIERTEAFYLNGHMDPLLSPSEWLSAMDYLRQQQKI